MGCAVNPWVDMAHSNGQINGPMVRIFVGRENIIFHQCTAEEVKNQVIATEPNRGEELT